MFKKTNSFCLLKNNQKMDRNDNYSTATSFSQSSTPAPSLPNGPAFIPSFPPTMILPQNHLHLNQTELIQMFYGTGPSRWLISLFGIKIIISIVGIFLNANLVFVTFFRATASLQSSCCRLIAVYALCTIFQHANFLVTFFNVVSGHNYIPYSNCFLLQLLPIFCSFAAFPLTFFISIERFLSVFFPIWYKKRKKKHILGTILSICSILGLYVTFKDFQTAMETPNLPVICAVGPKSDDSWVTWLILAMNLASILAYLSIWIRVKFNKSQNFSKYQKRLLYCLFVLLLLEIFGWSLSIFIRLIIGPIFGLKNGTFHNFLIINLVTNFAYISMAMNLPVLYIFSKEHKEVLRKHFGQIKNGLMSLIISTDNHQSNIIYVGPSTVAQNNSNPSNSQQNQ